MIELKKEKTTFQWLDYITLIVSMFFIAYVFLRLFGYYIDAITFVLPLIVAGMYMVVSMDWSAKATSYIIGIIALIAGLTTVELLCTNNLTFVGFVSMFTQLFMDMFPLYLVYTILRSQNKTLIRLILILTVATLLYVLVLTFIQIGKDDRFMRDMSINYTNYTKYDVNNAGGFSFAYAMAVLIGFLISLFLIDYQKNGVWIKIGLGVGLIAAILLVVNSSYTLALMISVIVIFIAIAGKIEKTYAKVIFWLCCIVGSVVLINVSDWIIAMMPTDEMKLRLSEVFMFFKEGDSSGYNLNGRMTLYWNSIVAFFKSPIIGNETLGFDPHSSILRFFAKDGILGGCAYLLLFYFGYRLVVKHFIGESKEKYFQPVFWALILMGMVNPIHSVSTVHYIAFFIAPLTLALLNTEKKEKNNEISLGN